MPRPSPSRSTFADRFRRPLAAMGLTAGLCAVAYAPLRAAAVDSPAEPFGVQVNLSAVPTTAAEALPSLPQRLTEWLYSVQRTVEKSAVSSQFNGR